jgi:hypothetical protein
MTENTVVIILSELPETYVASKIYWIFGVRDL